MATNTVNVVFDGALTGGFVATKPLLMTADTIVYDMIATVSVLAKIEFFLEFTSDNPLDPLAFWSREVSEDDAGNGVVHMPMVVRDLQVNGGTGLPIGVSKVTLQFVRKHRCVRMQVRAAVGTVTELQVLAPFGLVCNAPTS